MLVALIVESVILAIVIGVIAYFAYCRSVTLKTIDKANNGDVTSIYLLREAMQYIGIQPPTVEYPELDLDEETGA